MGRCTTDEDNREQMKNDPQFVKNREALEIFTQQYIHDQQTKGLMRGTHALPYIIPVVFHVLHNYGPENVPDDLIIESVRLMNVDFRKMNADTVSIHPAFKQIAADCEIEFRLATIDPFGNCTNGIEHIVSQKTYSANSSSKIHDWPNNKYLNIWVANTLESQTAAASTQFPGGPGATDGILCWYTYVSNTQRTLTHEAGHYFNLYHVWGFNNTAGVTCGDDLVNDTPISKGHNPGDCDHSTNLCNPPIVENLENYMDYSYCNFMFTTGQKVRMHALLNSTINGRNNLWTNSNLIATGTFGSPVTCAPISDFIANYAYACSGDSVHFFDLSWNATVTNWNWSFPGGSPSTSTLSNPSVLYTTSGYKNISLKVSNSAGADSITKTSVVFVTTNALNNIPYVESFEDSSSFPGNDGYVLNPDGLTAWTRVTNTAGSNGVSSIMINNYVSAAGSVDEWVTPSFDFSGISAPITISFKVSNAQRNSGSSDELKLFYTFNCGRTWLSTSYSKAGSLLATAGINPASFRPVIASQWRDETVAINTVHNKSNVRFKFQNTSNHGNNTYIDDINITGNGVGIKDIDELQTGFSVYPNPTSGNAVVTFSLSKSGNVKLEIKDILGQTVSKVVDEITGAGIHERKLPALSSGLYLIELTVINKHDVRKLVVS